MNKSFDREILKRKLSRRRALGTSAALAGAASLNMVLAGLSRPLVGMVVDRLGSKRVMLAGLGLAAIAILALSFSSQLWQFYLLFTIMSLGYGAASPATTVPLVNRWFVRRRATAQSVASSGTPMGELLVVPIMTALLILTDWRTAYRVLAAFVAFLVIPLGLALIRDDPAEMGLHPDGAPQRADSAPSVLTRQTGMTLREAMGTAMFWQLGLGFFVCGFTMSFASTHLMAFADDMAIEKMAASVAMGMVGGVSILATIVMGYLGDRTSVKDMLAVTYLLRGLAFFVLWQTHGVDVLFVGTFLLGLSWGSTVPLTSACVASACGRQYMGSIFGTLFAIMPIGSGLGAFFAGMVFDVSHSYGPALLVNGALGLVAAVTVYFLRPVPKPAGLVSA